MPAHRFTEQLPNLTTPAAAPTCGAGFMLCPMAVLGVAQPWQRLLYEQAYREAQAVVRPSVVERLGWGTNN